MPVKVGSKVRKVGLETHTLSVRLDINTWERLRQIAHEDNVSISMLINDILREGVGLNG